MEEFQGVVPMIAYADAPTAIDWLARVFVRGTATDGTISHAELDTGHGVVMLDDVDSDCDRARKAGAQILSEPEDGPPARRYRAEDIEGHRWMFMQHP
jgi:uncharacterized glyoxalase superfamily protein PhnB